ncbi:hypothetical protein EJ08DRAFT_646109 [Tothia fuscella]|uniref:Phagocyte signaling-impaired protein n=1 Tax=Tothia fuscella TaxID=1048955 RepID=A0A9P4P0X0_9PEZI|nr:hypothetical protein EJ08DRAFT_646109 [Tothia fuscella]
MARKYEQYEQFIVGYEKQPSQGLKAAKKKLQRNPEDVVYLLAEAHFLQRLGREKSALECCQDIKTSIKDPLPVLMIIAAQEIIVHCQHALQSFTHVAGSHLSNLWKVAIDGSGKGGTSVKEIQREMLRAALDNEYWDLAQQVFARLQKENPKLPQYHFAWVALSEMLADRMSSNESTTRDNLRKLAYLSAKATVDNTLQKKDTPRIISSAREMRLICQIYREQSHDTELLELLDYPDIGIKSEYIKNDIEFIRIKLEVMSVKLQWGAIVEFCFSALDELCSFREQQSSTMQAAPGEFGWADDWKVWESMINADSMLSQSEATNGLQKDDSINIMNLVGRFLVLNPKNRNAARASLLCHSIHDPSSMLAECQSYLNTFSGSHACFEDLRSLLGQLTKEQQDKVCEDMEDELLRSPENEIEQVSVASQTVRKVTKLKIIYHTCISHGRHAVPDNARANLWIDLCLDVYSHSLQELSNGDESADDACILAIMCLVWFAHKSVDPAWPNSYLVQAACLVENLRDNSPNNARAVLLSLCISHLLGLGSIALSAFHDLTTREIQYDTLSHLIYTRISILHPFGVDLRVMKALDDRHKNPLDGIAFALKWKPKAVDNYLNMMTKSLENFPFDKLLEFSRFKENLEKSMTIPILTLEKRRIARITGQNGSLETALRYPFDFSADNRDFKTIPDFEYAGEEHFYHLVLAGKKPDQFWLAQQTLHDLIQTMPTWKMPLPETQVQLARDLLKYIMLHRADAANELTASEIEVSTGWKHLLNFTFPVVGEVEGLMLRDPETLQKKLDDLSKWLKIASEANKLTLDMKKLAAPPFADHTALQHCILHLEILKAINKCANAALAVSKQKNHHTHGKLSADALHKMKISVKGNADEIYKYLREIKKGLESHGIEEVARSFVGHGKIGEKIEKIVPLERRQKYAREFVESGIEALDGVLRVKV